MGILTFRLSVADFRMYLRKRCSISWGAPSGGVSFTISARVSFNFFGGVTLGLKFEIPHEYRIASGSMQKPVPNGVFDWRWMWVKHLWCKKIFRWLPKVLVQQIGMVTGLSSLECLLGVATVQLYHKKDCEGLHTKPELMPADASPLLSEARTQKRFRRSLRCSMVSRDGH